MLHLVAWHQSAGGRHDPPPREAVVTTSEERADGPSGAGVVGLEGDLAIGQDGTWAGSSEDTTHGWLEARTFARARAIHLVRLGQAVRAEE